MNAPLVSDHEFISADFGSTGNRAISGRTLYWAVVDADLEGIVAKRLADAYHPKLAINARLKAIGPEVRALSIDQFTAFVRADIAKY